MRPCSEQNLYSGKFHVSYPGHYPFIISSTSVLPPRLCLQRGSNPADECREVTDWPWPAWRNVPGSATCLMMTHLQRCLLHALHVLASLAGSQTLSTKNTSCFLLVLFGLDTYVLSSWKAVLMSCNDLFRTVMPPCTVVCSEIVTVLGDITSGQTLVTVSIDSSRNCLSVAAWDKLVSKILKPVFLLV
jgi:hypothetical protein